ncbi:MAG: isoamylase early set domain-containing protein [Reichenbachiella sp.]
MSIKKQFLKTKDLYKVTWTMDKKTANGAGSVFLSGNFNEWSLEANPMEKLKNGSFKLIMELPKGQEYQFRYLLDNKNWLNEEKADGFTDNQLSNEPNSILSL